MPPEGWSADHLLLAALVRCSIDSLAYHARRAGYDGDGHRLGARHDHEARRRRALRFVEIDVRIEVQLDAAHERGATPLLVKASATASSARRCA